jgi:bacteriochlorophyllide a dehydrogenase
VSLPDLSTLAVVLEAPQRLALSRLTLNEPGAADVVVDTTWSGISTGTEKLLWSGRMPAFPGMGYPLVPGYESVGTVIHAGAASGRSVGDSVFVPGANCYGAVRGLFGGASQRIVVPGARVISCPQDLGDRGVLMSLAATAFHALYPDHAAFSAGQVTARAARPELIVGHGVLGRLMARILVAVDGEVAPTVWEIDPTRMQGDDAYAVMHPDGDTRKNYRCICDVSGDASVLDKLVQRLAPGGEIVLAGFYDQLTFAFAPAFMREARIRIAAQFLPTDLEAVMALVTSGRLSLDGLVTHHAAPGEAANAYATAFTDMSCLKMVLDWRQLS